MTTLEQPTNGHARLQEIFQPHDRWDLPVHDPIADDELAKLRTKKEQHLLANFDRWLAEELANEEPERQLPEFPIDALPKSLRNWAEAEARRTQTSVDVAAMLGLASSSAAIARRIWIEARAGRKSPTNLYVGLMCDDADRSGDVLSSAIAPLRELEREAIDQHPIDIAFQNRLQEVALEEIDEQEHWASDDDDRAEDLQMALEARAEIEARVPSQPPRWILDEVTARNLHRELGRHSRIACFSSEGEIFRQLAGRTSASRDRLVDMLNGAHAARDFVATMERGRLVSVQKPAITCASIFDPSLAATIAGQRHLRERKLLAKFLFVAPESTIGEREIAPEPMSPEVAAEYRDAIRRLAAREAKCLTLSQDADLLLREFEAEIESQLGRGGRLAAIRQWAAALPGQVLRIAAVLHSWKSDEPIVFRDTLAAAIVIGRYLLPHAAHLLETISAADDDCRESERPLLRFARIARSFSAREAMQHLRKTYLSPAALAQAIAGLVRRGYLRAVEMEPTDNGRPASPRFELAELRVWSDTTPAAPVVSDVAVSAANETTESTQNRVESQPESRPLSRRERRKEARRRRRTGG